MKPKRQLSKTTSKSLDDAISRSIVDKIDHQHSSTMTQDSYSQISSNKLQYAYNCSGCNKPIKRDKFLLKACEKYWHENCLRCDKCHTRLGELGSTLYHKSNMNLCRQDYLEMFGQTGVCAVCDKLICASEMVMRAKENVYHLECFACQLCSQRFCVGDRFYLCDNKIVCQYDFDELHGQLLSSSSQVTSSISIQPPKLIQTVNETPSSTTRDNNGFNRDNQCVKVVAQ